MFKQAKQSRAFEDIIRQIQESILDGELQEGDKLPGERTLREVFKVSRGTLREALRALEQKGLITIKTGVRGGGFICPIDNRLMSESLDLLLRHQKISLGELAEAREAVEGFIAAKAARRPKKQDVKQLHAILKAIRSHLDAPFFNWRTVIEEDSKFHQILSRMAGNRVFDSVVGTIYQNIYRYFDRYLSKDRGLQVKNFQDLCKIVEAIERHDSQRAQDLVREHVRFFNRIMERGEKGKGLLEI